LRTEAKKLAKACGGFTKFRTVTLLLIACSSRKLRTKGLLPVIERYDGVTYRVIRKAMREGYFPPNVDIKILSAKLRLVQSLLTSERK